MTEHESVRAMLPLAAAGALAPEELRRVDQHARECERCRRDLETWAAYTQGLRKLPQPLAPEGIVQRTQVRILRERSQAAECRRHDLFLGALAIFGWAAGWAFWILARAIAGGTWSSVSTVLVWMTAGTAALMLGRRRQMRRFL
jgi:anti-sigma factor RsiW